MAIIKDPEYLPVFHHIAKNAGTYVLSWMMMLCRKYSLFNGSADIEGWGAYRIRRGLLRLTDGKQLTCCYYTPTDINRHNPNFRMHSTEDMSSDDVDIETFIECIISKDIVPFSISIDPMYPGWESARLAIDRICESSNFKYLLHFTVLRNPFDRAQSIFHYLSSNNSKHEPTHGSIKSPTFFKYIQSHELEDSWFLRSLLDLPEDVIIEPYYLTLAHNAYLKSFRIKDISEVDNLIDSVFHGAYGILRGDVEESVVSTNLHKNETPNKNKVNINDLSEETRQTFLDRTYWDRKLWERYCGNET